MSAILVTTFANLMGARASRNLGIRFGARQEHRLLCNFRANRDAAVRTLLNSVAFISSSSLSVQQLYENQRKTVTLQSSLPNVNRRCREIHSTTTMLMARKKNGSKRKKSNSKSTEGSNELEDEEGGTVEKNFANDEYSLNGILDYEDAEDQESKFDATFASEYHAPVMPTECIDALLQRGEWCQMLLDRKERWRKKRRIIEAKRRRSELYDVDVDDDDDIKSGTNDGVDTDRAQLSSSYAAPTSNGSHLKHPRIFIDGTLGGGGHSLALIQQLSAGDILIGCDVDPEALSTASTRLTDYLTTREYILDMNENGAPICGWEEGRPMFVPVQSNFRNLITVLSKVRHPATGKLLLGDREMTNHKNTIDQNGVSEVVFPRGVNGMLLDLGVSSHQIDTSERGFAFMKEGPLDMRMSGNSQSSILTAADICNEFDESSLIDILRTYGDEPRARRIAAAIVASRPLHTTTDLVHAINSVTPTFARQKRAGLIATSARVFQALRIVVNEEDGALKDVLERVAPWALAKSTFEGDDDIVYGILAVLSYHSMEDKMAKRVIRDGKVDFFEKGSFRGGAKPERDMFGNIIVDGTENINLPFEPLAKPRKASDEEVDANSRSRSATLRVAIRI